MNFIKYCLLFCVFTFISIGAFSQQSSCTFKLEEAERLYETGILDSIPSMLRQCTNGGFDDEELARAYKLLILTYLFEDYQEMAELTMLKFLRKFPEYELKANDPVEFTYLYKSYKTIPTFSIGIILGLNYSDIRLIQPFNVENTGRYDGKYSSSGFGYQVGLQLKKYITEKIELNLDAIYTTKTFDYYLKLQDSEVNYTEDQTMLGLCLSGTYDFNINYKKFTPYARLGLNVDYLLSASANISRNMSDDATVDDVKPANINIYNDRSQINFAGVVGAGIKYHVKKGYAMLDVRYHLGLTNNVVPENRYSNNEKLTSYYYVDDDFAMNNLFVSLGYVFSIYTTKQKK